jgi:hypothetical protein
LQAGFFLLLLLFSPNFVWVARSTGHLSRRGLLPNLATTQREKEKIFKILAHALKLWSKIWGLQLFILREKKLKRFGGENKI